MKVGRILGKSIPNVDAIDVEILMASVFHVSRATLKAYPERELTTTEKEKFDELLQRRINGEPVAYLVGHKEFWSLDFIVTKDVLIPRSDTELLVEIALEQIEFSNNMSILDLGTGCGAIALSIAAERPDVMVLATDASLEALKIAQMNAKNLHIENIKFAQGDWYQALESVDEPCFDIILSNPPYIADLDPHLLQGDLRFEPGSALVAGAEGMDDLHIVISQAANFLLPEGQLIVEHGYDQEGLVKQAFAKAGFTNIICYKDISGIPRVTAGALGMAKRSPE